MNERISGITTKENIRNCIVKNMKSECGDLISNLEGKIKCNMHEPKSNVLEGFTSSVTIIDSGCLEAKQEKKLIDENYRQKKRNIIWNVLVIGFAFMIHFTAFMGTSNLQSSVNAADGLGTISLMITYIFMSLSTIFLPVALIKWLGCKWTLVLTLAAYIPYIIVQVYAKFYTLIPAAVLLGLGAGPLWCAQSVYVNLMAEAYAEIDNVPTKNILTRFFGIFYMLFQTSEIWGNLISSTVFSAGNPQNNTEDVLASCGFDFCPDNEILKENPNLERPPDEEIYTVAGIYVACSVFACLIVAFGLKPLKSDSSKERKSSGSGVTGLRLLVVTLQLLGDRRVLLLLPLTLWLGIQQAFRSANYTADYVSCAWGISNIGYVLICYGVTNSTASLLTGYLIKLTGRPLMMISGAVIQFGIYITLYLWTPVYGSVVFFLISGAWGVTDAIWMVQISAMYGTLFPGNEAAAYSNLRTWKSAGLILAYSYSPYLCASIKLYIVFGGLVVGTLGYCSVEWLLKSQENK